MIGALARRQRITRRPPRIDQTHPLAVGMRVCWVAGSNLLGQSVRNGSPTWSTTALGDAVDYPGVNTSFHNVGRPIFTTGARSAFAVGSLDAIGSTRMIVEENTGVSARPFLMWVAGTGLVSFGEYDGTTFYVATAGAVTLGATQTYGGSIRAGNLVAYLNGVPGSNVVPGTIPQMGNADLRIGVEKGSAGAWDGRLSLVCVWDRWLSADEHAQLAADPLCFLAPDPYNVALLGAIASTPPAPSGSFKGWGIPL